MTQFFCECKSICTLMVDVPDAILDEYPQLFEVDSYQFVVTGCLVGPDSRMRLVYLGEDFQIYKETK